MFQTNNNQAMNSTLTNTTSTSIQRLIDERLKMTVEEQGAIEKLIGQKYKKG